jgi:uncharacterized membrane protein YhiD involved in acid resistance
MDLLHLAQEYWTIIVAIIGIVTTFVRMESAIKSLKDRDDNQEQILKEMNSEHKEDVKEIRADLKATNIQFQKIEVAIKGIETTLQFIKDKVK